VERGKNMPQMQHNFAAYYFLLQLISLTCQLMAHFRFRSPTHTHPHTFRGENLSQSL